MTDDTLYPYGDGLGEDSTAARAAADAAAASRAELLQENERLRREISILTAERAAYEHAAEDAYEVLETLGFKNPLARATGAKGRALYEALGDTATFDEVRTAAQEAGLDEATSFGPQLRALLSDGLLFLAGDLFVKRPQAKREGLVPEPRPRPKSSSSARAASCAKPDAGEG